MAEEMANITLGCSVDIKRTDGRIHSAIVSSLHPEGRSVTVEWFEKGETKGKEVELDALFALNSNLIAKTNNENSQFNGRSMPISGNKLSRVIIEHLPQATVLLQCVTKSDISPGSQIAGGIPGGGGSYKQTKYSNRTTMSNVAANPMSTLTNGSSTTVVTADNTKVYTSQESNESRYLTDKNGDKNSIERGVGGAGRGRRSNVVKEVEKLKKQREERRQRQAEMKEEKEALMNVDPGNPNWEFLAMIREYQSNIEFRPLQETDAVEDHQITVCVRKRPLNKKELTRKEVGVITVPYKDTIVVHEPKNKVDLTKYLDNQLFRFDYAFDDNCSNEIVYKFSAKPLVKTIFEGGMATCFAYGQTGSGKTHTMGGDFNGKTQDCKKGIYAMAAKDVFKLLKSPKYKGLNLHVSASFFEIYSGKVFDLLAEKAKLRVLEDGKQQVQIVGLTEQVVDSVEEVLKLIQHGNSARTSGQTSANSNSSRSHAVFQIILRAANSDKVHGKFSLIDLAGNERGADTSSANRQTRMEGAEINKSLLALKECIRALGRKGAHLPFRASKLTQVLRDSFIGDKSRTCMIAMISPGMSSCEHSLNTLRYADRVKELAATDPTEGPPPPQQIIQRNSKRTSPSTSPQRNNSSHLNDSDLAQLRSLNEGEISADLYDFHEAVSQLQIQEEIVLDNHKSLMEQAAAWHEQDAGLVLMTRDVDYDQDAYSLSLLQLTEIKISTLQQFLEKVHAFRSQLVAEEKLSQKMKYPHHHQLRH
uniref:Kinesin-like protein n=1 Tax=Cacopsylla melanoneura TaxID=428564 RepID=A0A8D8X3Q9_9HEMI